MWALVWLTACWGPDWPEFQARYVDLRCRRETNCLPMEQPGTCAGALAAHAERCDDYEPGLARSCLDSYRGGSCDEVFDCFWTASGDVVCPETLACERFWDRCAGVGPRDTGGGRPVGPVRE